MSDMTDENKASALPERHRFWSHDGVEFDTHATADEARTRAKGALTEYSDEATSDGDGWPEEVTHVMWGEIREQVTPVNFREHADGCTLDECTDGCDVGSPKWTYAVDYELTANAKEEP